MSFCFSFIVLLHCVYFRLMQAACDMAFKYAHERKQFGQQIGTFQVKMICIVCLSFYRVSLTMTECDAVIAILSSVCLPVCLLSFFADHHSFIV